MKAFISAIVGCLVIAIASAVILGTVNTKGDERPVTQSVRLN